MNSDHRAPNRPTPRISQVLNPVWLASDDERNMRWPWWRWFLRNPFCNFHATVIGVADCYRTVYWKHSPWTFREEGGWNYGYTIIDSGSVPLPFMSYRCRIFECGIGWKTSGFFGYSLRRAHSGNATEAP